MSLRRKKKQLVAAAMAALMSVSAGVPEIVAAAPSVLADTVNPLDAQATPAYTFTISEDTAGMITGVEVSQGTELASIEQIIIPASQNGTNITGIDKQAFKDCAGLKSIVIPTSVKTILTGAFDGTTEGTPLTTLENNIYYEGTETEWQAIVVGQDTSAPDNVTDKTNTGADALLTGADANKVT